MSSIPLSVCHFLGALLLSVGRWCCSASHPLSAEPRNAVARASTCIAKRMQRLTAEERGLVRRAAQGGGRSSRRASRAPEPAEPPQYSYPAGASTHTLGLLGKLDALLKAEPRPPTWALMRVLSLLEEERATS